MDPVQLSLEVLGGTLVGLSLGLMGAGGAILSMPIFTLVLGHALSVAKIEALAVIAVIAMVSGSRALAAKQTDRSRFLAFAIPGLVGAWLGGPIGKATPPLVQAVLFGALALVAAWRMTATPQAADQGLGRQLSAGAIALAAVTGLAIGILTSVIGVGGGFLLVPALVLITGLPMQRAAGTSLLVICVNSLVGIGSAAFHAPSVFGEVAWTAVAIVSGCGVLGSMLGARLAARLPAVVLRRIFAAVLVAVSVAVILKESGALGSPG